MSQGVAYQPELKTVKPTLPEQMPESTPFGNQTFHFSNQNTVHKL